MLEQKWFCEACETHGSIDIDEHADVMTVVYKIEDDHRNSSPNCNQSVSKIRVID